MRVHLSWIAVSVAIAACGDNVRGNHAPEASDLVLTTDEDTPVMRALATDVDVGDELAVTVEASPMHGTLAVDGTLATYTPAANYHGPDAFTFTVSDGVDDAGPFTVSITVSSVNDTPVPGADQFATDEDSPITLTGAMLIANDTDPDGDALTVNMISNVLNGSASISNGDVTFIPTANFNGDASFQYSVTDGTSSAIGTVTITVSNENDPPVAVDDSVDVVEDTALTIPTSTLLANDTDAENQTLSITAVANAQHGTVSLSGNQITFTPDPDFDTTGAQFEYTVTDGADTDTGLVTVNVVGVNDPPVAHDDVASTDEDTAISFSAANLLANDTDPDTGDVLTVTSVENATNGNVALNGTTITFTPNLNFSGVASFEYTISDGTASASAQVTIAIASVNDAPVPGDDLAATDEDTPVDISAGALLANDLDAEGDTLTVTAVANASGGSVALVGTTITFTPTANFNGDASFDYTVSDGTASSTGKVTVTVAPINDAPVAGDDSLSVQINTPTDIAFATLLANDTDVDGTPLAITSVQNAVNGTVTLNATSVHFVPDNNFVGTATFEYVVADSGTLTDVALVTIDVTTSAICGDATISAPETCDDGNAAPGDGCSATCQVENGFNCTGSPSTCTPICGDGLQVGNEQCDDGNQVDTDGCTSKCKTGVVCTAAAFTGGDRFAVDPDTGHCYVSFDTDKTTFAAAETTCNVAGGYLATVTSAGENALVLSVQNPLENPWIGGQDDANTTDAVFDWVTDEGFGFTAFDTGEPDDDAGVGGNGDCLHLNTTTGGWADTNCNLTTFVVGRICEFELSACGDSVLEPGEECDDSNSTAGDGCSATCQLEVGCGNGVVDAGEECDDDNLANGDGCSSTCKLEHGNGVLDPNEQCDDGNTTDGDGCSANGLLERLIFSEYVEGSSNNKAVEIKNLLTSSINLKGCTMQLFSNGSTTATATFNFADTVVTAGDVFVVCNPGSNPLTLLPKCDLATGTGSIINYNGDDAVRLACGTTTMDVIGQIGFQPVPEWGTGDASTKDNTIRRKCSVTAGDTNGADAFDPAGEWAGFPVDTFAGLGDPACAP
jgi:cysteine-rich repeat protein